MTTVANPEPGEITYAEWLQRQINDRLSGVQTICGPPIYDLPTIWDRLGLIARPNAALERRLEIQLRELEHHAKPEARLESEAEIEM
jgi:hypothetical protein